MFRNVILNAQHRFEIDVLFSNASIAMLAKQFWNVATTPCVVKRARG